MNWTCLSPILALHSMLQIMTAHTRQFLCIYLHRYRCPQGLKIAYLKLTLTCSHLHLNSRLSWRTPALSKRWTIF
ncbi:hypothetical protein C8R42DRAFT_654456 [Lentinula raphanica]|nr:hypothetical protein C8R42DRAFT_654456 [Lentinula raphanica]